MWVQYGDNWAMLSQGWQTLRMRTVRGECFEGSCPSLILLTFPRGSVFFSSPYTSGSFPAYSNINLFSLGSCISSLPSPFLTNLLWVPSLRPLSRFHNKAMLWPYEVLNCTRPAPALCFLSESVMWCFSAFLDCFALELTTLLTVFCLFPIPSFFRVCQF